MKPFFVVQLLCSILVAGAETADFTPKIPEKATELGFTSLVQQVSNAGLADYLNGPGPFTVLAPTNDAFSKIPPSQISDPNFLEELLKYHVIPGQFLVESLADEFQLITTSTMYRFARVTLYRQGTANVQVAAIQCAPLDLSRVDQKASNGLIHALTAVMIPPLGDIMDYLEANTEAFSTLISVLQLTGLDTVLRTPGPFTLFAPTNDAFNQIPPATLENLTNDLPLLLNILKLHILSGTYCSAGIVSGDVITQQGLGVTLTRDSNGITVQNSKVIVADGSVSNGVVHHIDQIILDGNIIQ